MSYNYSGQNLRGRLFKGQNLERANFSNADIRSTDFTDANLKGADFTNAKAGLQKRWTVGLLIITWFLSALLGFTVTLAIFSITSFLIFPETTQTLALITVLTVPIVFIIIISLSIRRNLRTGSRNIVNALEGTISLGFSIFGSTTALTFLGLIVVNTITGTQIGNNNQITSIVIATTLIAALISASGLALTLAGSGVICISNILSVFVIAFAVIFGCIIATKTIAIDRHSFKVMSIILNFFADFIGINGGLKAIAEDDTWLATRSLVINVAVTFGTNFSGADLTDAKFTRAILKNTNFRNAILTRTSWFKTQKLHRAAIGESYLKDTQVRQLVITAEGQNKKFDNLNLQGVHLGMGKANLVDASFIGANLSQANLQDADLSRAKLVQTQLDATDFTGATLTGACIEDWGITSHTQLHGVRCEYVFMRIVEKGDPDRNPCRKPDNWNETFADGDFADFIKPIVDTLDLYHNSSVDPRAIAISFKQLAENHPDAELEIVAMEKRGQDKFLLRAKTAPEANKSELSKEYFDTYNQLKALAEQEVKALIAEKENQIRRLENMVMTALERPSFYAQTYNNQGDTMPRKQSNFNLQGAQFGGGLVDAETVTAHQIGGNITNHAQVAPPETNSSTVKTILILASNPRATTQLRLDEEVREIDAGLQRAKKRELFDLKQRWAVRVQDVYRSLLDFKPQIVHFSGHGTGDDGLVLEDETGNVRLVETVALAGLFELFAPHIECVVLNACYSEVQAEAIATHIPYVIGMNKAIGDLAAIKFATGFYSALGAGESVEFAYKLGCSVIQLDGIAEHLTPVLKKK